MKTNTHLFFRLEVALTQPDSLVDSIIALKQIRHNDLIDFDLFSARVFEYET